MEQIKRVYFTRTKLLASNVKKELQFHVFKNQFDNDEENG